jgi:hypothetical protein
MFWMGAVYNFCRVHATLQGAPAMAADLTDQAWCVDELLGYRLKRDTKLLKRCRKLVHIFVMLLRLVRKACGLRTILW